MPTFIEKSYCKGNRPAGIVGLHHNLRSSITGSMLRERGVPRFLVAPMGYGKSSCAYEYAQVVFDFEHVFWIKCDSPCFLRDLDEGSIFAQISSVDPLAKLAVFDDVPHLDQDRAESFDGLLRELMDAGIEVVVACAPSVDSVSARHVDKILLQAADLIPSEDEVEMERMRGNKTREEAKALASPRGAACLLWGEGGVKQIVKGLAAEELPGELELAVFCMLVLGDGRIESLSAMISPSRLGEDATYLAPMFPYLGLDLDAGTFSCIEVSPADILACSRFSPSMLGKASVQGERDPLAIELADMLLGKGEGERAADLLMALGTRAAAGTWLAANGWELLSRSWALPVEMLASGARAMDADLKGAVLALRCWALAMLGDGGGSARMSSRIMRSPSSTWWQMAAATVAPCVLDDIVAPESLATNAGMVEVIQGIGDDDDDPCRLGAQGFLHWEAMLELELLRNGEGDASGYLGRFEEWALSLDGLGADAERKGLRNALLVSGSWFLGQHVAPGTSHDDGSHGEGEARIAALVAPVVTFVSRALASAEHQGSLTWPECVAANALQGAIERFPYAFDEGISPKLVSAARSTAVKLMVQSDRHRKGVSSKEEAKGEYELTHEDSFRAKPQPASKVASLRVATPSLVISLFGGAEAWIGADRAEPRQIKRKNAKIALAMLVLNRGREITKEKMASTLWPDAPADNARQNLYVVWSYLKKSLSVGSSCPYLISTQTGYKLDSRFVISDSQQFDELCKELLFGRDDKDAWEELYEKVSGDFAEDLLPEVTDNAYIDGVRRRLRTQMVDGLVEASSRMWREGETRGAIWFAREALRRDRSREDAYIALMEAQIASNQRGAALDTYFECRRYLSEQLGIDPSKRVVELYRSVIETEEDF